MSEELHSLIKHQLLRRRIALGHGIRRFHFVMIERDLFGTIRLARHWGRIGANGQALEAVAWAKR